MAPPAPLPAVHIETAVFVDRDLVQHMALNFPIDTEREVVRFVLAMVNAVSLSVPFSQQHQDSGCFVLQCFCPAQHGDVGPLSKADY